MFSQPLLHSSSIVYQSYCVCIRVCTYVALSWSLSVFSSSAMAARLISFHGSQSSPHNPSSLINTSRSRSRSRSFHAHHLSFSGVSDLASLSPRLNLERQNLGNWNLRSQDLPSRFHCRARTQNDEAKFEAEEEEEDGEESRRKRSFVSVFLYVLAGVYILWLFVLPYAPGDPLWAIKQDTISIILDLSLNFLYILPITNSLGFHFLESPVVHPTMEALFNFVIGWSLMFAPLLFADRRSNRFKGSLVYLWVVQMFLTNTVLIPYMGIRLRSQTQSEKASSREISAVEETLTSEGGSKTLSIVGGVVAVVSIWWFFLGRPDESFGNFSDRWTFFLEYLSSDRVGYAFIWDICLYTLFQPWLIGDNLSNIDKENARVVEVLRYIPCVGLVAYLWSLTRNPNKTKGK